jgi:hypothetical protein
MERPGDLSWLMLILVAALPFALLLRKLGPDYADRLDQRDAFARWFGAAVFCQGLLLAFIFAYLPYQQALRHEPKVRIWMGAAAFPVLLVLSGLIYIVAGKKGRSFVPTGFRFRECTRRHFVTGLLLILLAVGAEIAFERHFLSLGYRVIGVSK